MAYPDDFVNRANKALSLDTACPKDVQSLRNWLSGTKSINKAETTYLDHDAELACLAPGLDSALLRLDDWISHLLIKFMPRSRLVRQTDFSSSQIGVS